MGDFISREDTIDKMQEVDWYHQNKNGEMVHGANSAEHQAWYKAEDVYKVLKGMPSAQPKPDINPLPEQPDSDRLGAKTGETCTDTISRQDAINTITEYGWGDNVYMSVGNLIGRIEQLPSAQQERPKGEWLANGDIHKECPFCGEDWDKYVFGEVWYTEDLPKFCPNCGADMRGERDE